MQLLSARINGISPYFICLFKCYCCKFMINFDSLLKNKRCACVPEGGWWVQEGIGVFRIGIGHFFADVKVFIVKMA